MDEASPAAPLDRPAAGDTVLNVPNQLTFARLALAIVFFVFLACNWYLTSLGLFIAAAVTDWFDGYWARKYKQITQVGRVLDPLADKVVVCGAFIFLAAVPQPLGAWLPASGIAPWMAVVVVVRELLVTALRTFFEEGGTDFSAKWAGKWKMLFQCFAIGFSLFRLQYFSPKIGDWAETPPDWITYSLYGLVALAVVMTIYSGWGYVRAAVRMLSK
jgi:CDP-diacylglycerol---glycerol-3-phosphate 3-phosphatidyltransferase